jgi:poly(hydroxyalkanoate) granule associated protein phasin
MLKQAAGNINANRVADAALAASRQMWLAGLGAAVVTREWARKDAGHMFRALVKEGSAVESRTLRVIGRSVESSIALATTAWNRTRDTARTTVGGLVETAAAALPAFKAPAAKRVSRTTAKKTRSAKARVSRKGRRAKRTA